MRTIAEAAKQAARGEDETLWQACWQNIRECSIVMTEKQMIEEIKSWSSEERNLYDIGEA